MWETVFDKMVSRLILNGQLRVTYPDGRTATFGPGGTLKAAIEIRDTAVLRGLCTRPDLTLGEAAAQEGLLEQQIAPAACKRVRAFFDQAVRWRLLAAAGEPVHEILMRIMKDIGYESFLEADDPDSAGARGENVA